MFIKYIKGYVNTDKIHFFTIKPDNYNDPTEYAIFGKIGKNNTLSNNLKRKKKQKNT